MRLALLSDIHANVTSLKAVLEECERRHVEKFVLLGDLVNYGMRPNEIVEMIRNLDDKFVAKIWGNHEKAVMDNDTTRFATDRGRAILHYTQSKLTQSSIDFINNKMNRDGICSLQIDGKKFLLVHGIWGDPYWGKFTPAELSREEYAEYDYVLTAHSHVCHYFEVLFKADAPATRNKKKTIFINPGSVGQPRNINPCAQFGILDTATTEYEHVCVPYDIVAEQELYTDEVDVFYRDRLTLGI